MATGTCPSCGNVLRGERPSFCEQCGCDLSQAKAQQANQISPFAVTQEKGDSSMLSEEN